MKYILDTSILQPCDIILTRDKKVVSKTVRHFTDSDYSHALICLTNNSLIEATLKGRVFTENPQRLIFDTKDQCKVLRLKTELPLESQKKIIDFLRDKIGSMYSVREAISTKKFAGTDTSPKDETQFCSRLVAQAYNYADITLVGNPNYCAPEELNTSALLDVVSGAVRIALEADISFAKQPSQIKENQKQTYLWLDAVTELAKQENFRIIKQADVSKFLIQYPKHDQEVCKSICNTNYLQQYKLDEIVNPGRYKFDPHAELDFDIEYQVNYELSKRHRISYLNSTTSFKHYKLEYFSLLQELYKNLLMQVVQRLEAIETYLLRDMYLYKEKREQLMKIYQDVETLKDDTRKIIS